MMRSAHLLTAKPMFASIAERTYRASARGNTWVQFNSDEGTDWVGVFGNSGEADYSAAVPFADDGGRTVLVIARGQGYIVDASNGTLIRETPWSYSYSALAVPGRDFVLVADSTSIWRTSRTADVRAIPAAPPTYRTNTDSVALDGIVFDTATTDELTGVIWEPDGWYHFRLRYDTMQFNRGGLATRDETAYSAIGACGGFPQSIAYYRQMTHYWLS